MRKEPIDTFNMIKELRKCPVIDNELIQSNLLAAIATELYEMNKTLKQLERNIRR